MLRSAFLILVLALATGCASVSTSTAPSPAQTSADRLAASGDHLQAARAWAAAADDSRGAARDHAWLMAADQYLLAGDKAAARQALGEASPRKMIGSDLVRHDLLTATFLADDGARDKALARLGAPAHTVPTELRVRWHTLRAGLLEAGGRGFDAAADLAQLNAVLDRGARVDNLRRIERLLADTPDGTLAQGSAALPVGHPLYPYAARALTRRGMPLPRPLERGESMAGFDTLPPADHDGYRPPMKLGVLLPLSGPLAAAGQSVRDGMLAGFYAESRRRPEIKFYDTAGNAAGARQALAQATSEGAQMLVGPLTREEVDMMFGMPELEVPVIALNRGAVPPPTGSITFALSPEEEGAAAADRLADRRMLRVMAVSQADDGALRALAAFRQRFEERGGTVIGDARVSEGNPDYVPVLQGAMGGTRPDALFLALKAAPARLLSSQMDLAGLTGVPRVATSLILSGSNLRQDTELDGIEFPELPWLLGLRSGLPDSDTVGTTLPSAKGGGARLFAFGHDAWKLSGYLDNLLTDPAASIQGATGELQLDAFGGVSRRPAWAVFSGGRTRPAMDGALLPDTITQ